MLFLLVLSLTLASCATRPEPRFAADIHVIDHEQLPEYWVPIQKNTRFMLNAQNMPENACAHVVLEFLIDSNGNVFNPVIKEAAPKGAMDYAALKSLSLTTYDPADTNLDRTPVKVTQRTTVKFGDADCA